MSILNTIHYIFVASCLIGNVGCGIQKGVELPTDANPSEQVPADPSEAAAPSIVAAISPLPSVSPIPSPITLNVYSLTKTVATASGGIDNGVTLTGTGSCVVYETKTYCFDDGLKRFPHPTQTGGYSYWGMDETVAVCPNMAGNCQTDLMSRPILMSAGIVAKLNTVIGVNLHRTVSEVLTNGAITSVSCTLDDTGLLDCGSFIVDTVQGAL